MLISTKQQLSFYLQADRMMNRGQFKPTMSQRFKEIFLPDFIMDYLVCLRRVSFYKHGGGILNKLFYMHYLRKLRKLSSHLGISIGCDVFGYGLLIPHWGTVVVGARPKIGNYAVLHTGICITDTDKVIGDCLYMSTGAKITAQVILGDNITVAANSVVTHSFENNMLIGGAPAKMIKESKSWVERDTRTDRMKAIEDLKVRMGIKQ